MKYVIAATLLVFSSISFAEVVQLPDVRIGQEVLGGDILLIKMKAHLVITGKESQELENELGGIDGKKQFTRDIIMTKSYEELVAQYNPANDRKTVQAVIDRYAIILAQVDGKLSLN